MFNETQVSQYRRDGFTLYPNFFSPKEVGAFLMEAESICAGSTLAHYDKVRLEMEPNQPPEGTQVRRLCDPCTHYPLFRTLSESRELLDCLAQLVGPNLLFHYSKLNMKPAAVGSVVEWHQDLAYYPLTNRDSLAVLFYLDDADLTNGCLEVIPGRQEGPLMDHTLNGFFQGKITQPIDESQAVPVGGKAGTAVFMHCMTPHASAPNRSDRPRRTLILSYRAADAYPIHQPEISVASEVHERLVRGQDLGRARFTMTEFPIPKRQWKTDSLYELQELSRRTHASQ